MASRKLNILSESLIKKEKILNEKLQNHFDTVAQANGQPLNDKRNGQKTLAKWEAQNDCIRRQMDSIERTKNAIEKEEFKISVVDNFHVPSFIKPFLDNGEIIQWRKHPNRFFVVGVEKARLVWNENKQTLGYSHLSETPLEQRELFKMVANRVLAKYRNYKGEQPHD